MKRSVHYPLNSPPRCGIGCGRGFEIPSGCLIRGAEMKEAEEMRSSPFLVESLGDCLGGAFLTRQKRRPKNGGDVRGKERDGATFHSTEEL